MYGRKRKGTQKRAFVETRYFKSLTGKLVICCGLCDDDLVHFTGAQNVGIRILGMTSIKARIFIIN